MLKDFTKTFQIQTISYTLIFFKGLFQNVRKHTRRYFVFLSSCLQAKIDDFTQFELLIGLISRSISNVLFTTFSHSSVFDGSPDSFTNITFCHLLLYHLVYLYTRLYLWILSLKGQNTINCAHVSNAHWLLVT